MLERVFFLSSGNANSILFCSNFTMHSRNAGALYGLLATTCIDTKKIISGAKSRTMNIFLCVVFDL